MSVEVTRLANGLTVATETMPSVSTAAVSLTFGAGARTETPRQHGLAHLLEHMAFKGTTRRSAQRIAEEIEEVGGDLNAATGVEQTAYYARVMGEDVPRAVDILGDIVVNPLFDPDELKREQGVIVQEIGAVDDTPDDLVFDMLQEAAYPGQPLGRSILGTPETVRALTRADCADFRDTHYRGGRGVLTAVGAVEHARLVELAEATVGGIAAEPSAPAPAARWQGGELRLPRDLEQAHVALAFPGRALGEPETYALQVFAGAVGGGMSSRLFQEVREKRGLAYTIQAFHWSYSDTGILGIYAGTAEEDVAELVSVAVDELARAAADLTEAEVARARAQMRMTLALAGEQAGARAEQIARHILVFGRPLPTSEILERLAAVTLDDVRRAAAAALSGTPALSAVGPIGGLTTPDRIAARIGLRAA